MSQEFINAKHKIDRYLISTMAMNEKTLTFNNSETGNGKECPLYGDVHTDIKEWYKSICFDWSEQGDTITLTWS